MKKLTLTEERQIMFSEIEKEFGDNFFKDDLKISLYENKGEYICSNCGEMLDNKAKHDGCGSCGMLIDEFRYKISVHRIIYIEKVSDYQVQLLHFKVITLLNDEHPYAYGLVGHRLSNLEKLNDKISRSIELVAKIDIDLSDFTSEDVVKSVLVKSNTKAGIIRKHKDIQNFNVWYGVRSGTRYVGFKELNEEDSRLYEMLGLQVMGICQAGHCDVEEFLRIIENCRKVETLYKAGFTSLVDAIRLGYRMQTLLKREGFNIKEIIHLPKAVRNGLKDKLGSNLFEVERLCSYDNFNVERFSEVYGEGKEFSIMDVTRILELGVGIKVDKLFEYMEEVRVLQAIEYSSCLMYLYDYLNVVRDIRESFPKYPKSLKLAHDVAVRDYQLIKEFKRDDLLLKRKEEFGPLDINNDEYMIIVPETGEELVMEGRVLGHCVGTYANRLAEGKTFVGFIRRKENPDKHLYTVEVRDGMVTQLEGKKKVRWKQLNQSDNLKKFLDDLVDRLEENKKLRVLAS